MQIHRIAVFFLAVDSSWPWAPAKRNRSSASKVKRFRANPGFRVVRAWLARKEVPKPPLQHAKPRDIDPFTDQMDRSKSRDLREVHCQKAKANGAPEEIETRECHDRAHRSPDSRRNRERKGSVRDVGNPQKHDDVEGQAVPVSKPVTSQQNGKAYQQTTQAVDPKNLGREPLDSSFLSA